MANVGMLLLFGAFARKTLLHTLAEIYRGLHVCFRLIIARVVFVTAQ